MCLPSNGSDGSVAGSLPRGEQDRARLRASVLLPSLSLTSTLPGPASLAVPLTGVTPFFLNRQRDAVGVALDDAVLALHHRGQVEVDLRQDDAVLGELVLGLCRRTRWNRAGPCWGCSRR